MKRRGNLNRYTLNIGHDVAKNRLADKLTDNGNGNGFDIYAIRKALINHPTIKQYQAEGKIKVGRVIGQNFTVGCRNQLNGNNNPITKKAIVAQVVNNILNSILDQAGFKGYGKTQFWQKTDNEYGDRIRVGADILTLDWIKSNYSQEEFTKKLSERQQIKKYR